MNRHADFPVPTKNALNAPYWDALGRGQLAYQHCEACGHAWLPARSECPHCLSPEHGWEMATGRGKLISWVVYHRAFNPAFQDRVPYNVAVVQLDEGPRMISNIVGLDPEHPVADQLSIDQPLQLVIRREHDVAIPCFAKVAA
ncbi:Zn-ribbon domain-containing OB-fold protein [Mameliella alba]|uniref:DNA-binding protein n=1 Tax=Mameliella alba TaxID=561184 RepID=A0A0B3SMD2_9RHOB|nr:Zn-ribbon domain-containing OB-fold protein [Mameliella alba]KHQ51694.1 hypothetical protein OA50_03857 [Mameliella alba]OWV46253.1 DNA-binding protein [Mameliella alba]GGF74852.1 hypothetical protein GCM10011319_39110 [Mameliella alba]